MENVYCIFKDEELLFICYNESDAQEMILTLTEEYVYHAYLREADRCGNEMALWLFQHAPKYGWNKFWYKKGSLL